MNWIEKYRADKFEDIKGQDAAVAKAKIFLKYFGSGKKAMILHGPPGTGKTTLTHILAKENNSELFELNASDLRNKDKLREVLKPAIEQKSLSKKSKIILVDEVDGISGVDKGGLSELLTLVNLSKYPVIITANDVWDRKLNQLRQKCEMTAMKEVDYRFIEEILNQILKKEKIVLNPNIVKSISTRVRGDIRAAINDLQAVAYSKDPSLITFDERNKEIDIFNALRIIFKEKASNETLKILDSVNMTTDEIILWVEENIPLEYQGKELERAYDLLSKVDLFKGRIYKQQYWRFLIYENIFLSYGISSAKQSFKKGFTSYKKPSRILKIWLHNQRTAKKKSISEKYAKFVHVGTKRAMSEFPIIKNIIKSNPKIIKELKLEKEEIEYLMEN